MGLLAVLFVLLFAVLALVALMPLSLVMRYRRGTARRLARGWVATLNVMAIASSTTLFLTTAALANVWVPRAFAYSAAGLAAGCVLGTIGLRLSRWEAAPQSLHYTPNRWLVLAIMLVVTSRLFYGVWRAWHAWHTRADEVSWLARSGAAGSLAIGAAVLGYYLTYWFGIRRRLKSAR